MTNQHKNELKEAAEHLKGSKNKINSKNKQSTMTEPKSLVSGVLDEVEIRRRDKQVKNHE